MTAKGLETAPGLHTGRIGEPPLRPAAWAPGGYAREGLRAGSRFARGPHGRPTRRPRTAARGPDVAHRKIDLAVGVAAGEAEVRVGDVEPTAGAVDREELF